MTHTIVSLPASDYLWHLYPTFGCSEVRGSDCMLPLVLLEGPALHWFHAAARIYCTNRSWPKGCIAN